MTKTLSTIKTPDWVKDAIFYQIFPDRFSRSQRVEKPHNLEPWDSPPTVFGFKGGDLIGVYEHLDYLQDLGVNAIYFTPIFQSTANHRYHTHDYYQVDPILGGNKSFKTLLDAAHARGMRIVLDGVFNHASRGLLQFNHALENGGASPYVDWFHLRDFPLQAYTGKPNYGCWYNLPALPKFNYANPQVREFTLGVAEHWIRQGIDGWRLDVPEEIDDDDFWRAFRQRVKAINPDAYLVGEIWHRADRWLTGDQFDAVMNYQFTRACLSFFVDNSESTLALTQPGSYGKVAQMDAVAFAQSLDEIVKWYPREITYAQLNLLDSHDTARFLTIAGGDITALKLALLAMFTFPGAPTIYYGDEIGLEGGQDPDSRRSMVWDSARWNRDALDTTKRYTALRNNHAALRRGSVKGLYAQGKTVAYARSLDGERMIVALNADHSPVTFDMPIEGGARLVPEWLGEPVQIINRIARGIRLSPREGKVWRVE
jgi:cyclomaltodextrinase